MMKKGKKMIWSNDHPIIISLPSTVGLFGGYSPNTYFFLITTYILGFWSFGKGKYLRD